MLKKDIDAKKQVNSMPAIERLPLSEVVNEVNTVSELGIPAVMLFGIPSEKDDEGTSKLCRTWNSSKAIMEIKKNFGRQDCSDGRCMPLSIYIIRSLWNST